MVCVGINVGRPILYYLIFNKKVKVVESRNRPGVAERVPGDLGSQIFMTFDT
jgi:hypothetical protein